MLVRALLRLIKRSPARSSRLRQAVRRAAVPCLCPLEDRILLSAFQVLNLHDSGPGSLRAAISAANTTPGADTITFASGLAGTIKLTSGDIVISDNVTIKGPGDITVSGGGTSRVFDIANLATVTIHSLAIDRGSASHGGGILNEAGSNLTLTGCTFDANQAVPDASGNAAGGAVFNAAGAALHVLDCQFANNQANGPNQSFGGAIANAGLAAIAFSTFQGNQALDSLGAFTSGSATGSQGGAIMDEDGARLYVTTTSFISNQAVGGDGGDGLGGAIANEAVDIVPFSGQGVKVNITTCTFRNNQAVGGVAAANGGFGGAIDDLAGTTLHVNGCDFVSNQASNGGGTSTAGGAINNAAGGTARIDDSTVQFNKAVGTNGAAADGGGVVNLGTLTIKNTSFIGNSARAGFNSDGVVTTGRAGGGAIENAGAPDGSIVAVLIVGNCQFRNNEATGGDNAGVGGFFNGAGLGGAVENINHAQMTAQDCSFEHNQAVAGNFAGSPAFGGAIWNAHQSSLTVASSTMKDNAALGGSSPLGQIGGSAFGGGIDNYDASHATVRDCTIADNRAVGGSGTGMGDGGFAGGGGVSSGDQAILFNVHDPCTMTISGTLFSHNQVIGGSSGGVVGDLNSGADGLGGGLFLADGPVDVSTCTFQGNRAVGGAGINGPGGDGYGGGIAVGYNGGTARLDLDTTTVTANGATGGTGSGGYPGGDGHGGALFITGGAHVFVESTSAVFGNFASTDHPNIFGDYTTDNPM
jgi:hypothetical protein